MSPHRYTEWLPAGWQYPTRVDLGTGHHLRPVRAADAELDLAAVLGSRERLWATYGAIWGWPPPTMTLEQDRDDLAHHEAEIESRESFRYALFDAAETALLGCVYIEPPLKEAADAEVSWWVVDRLLAGPVAAELDRFVPGWIQTQWPFRSPRIIGVDITWADYLALPYVGLTRPVHTSPAH